MLGSSSRRHTFASCLLVVLSLLLLVQFSYQQGMSGGKNKVNRKWTDEETEEMGEHLSNLFMPKGFKRADANSPVVKEGYKWLLKQKPQYGGKVTLCEVAVKQTEEDTTFWLNLGKKRKCKQDIFRISNILIKALEGDWTIDENPGKYEFTAKVHDDL